MIDSFLTDQDKIDILRKRGYSIVSKKGELFTVKGSVKRPISETFRAIIKDTVSNYINLTDTLDVVLETVLEHENTSPHLQFSGLSKITVGTTPPSNPSVGDIWINVGN